MNTYEIIAFSLTEEEATECRARNIPNFFWYYLQIQEKNLGIKDLKKLIQSRIASFPFLEKKKINLANDISKQIRKFVLEYQAQARQTTTATMELEKKFDFKIFSLIKKVLRRREIVEKSRQKKKKERELELKKARKILSKTVGKISQPVSTVPAVPQERERSSAKEIFREEIIQKNHRAKKQGLRKIYKIIAKDGEVLQPALASLKGPKDWDCLYFHECREFAKKNKMCLDCSFCDKRYYI